MKVWLLTRIEDDYDTSLEVVNAYATEALAKAAAEAENIETPVWDGDGVVDDGHPAAEMRGRLTHHLSNPDMTRTRAYVWHVFGLEVVGPPPVTGTDVAREVGLRSFDAEGRPVFMHSGGAVDTEQLVTGETIRLDFDKEP